MASLRSFSHCRNCMIRLGRVINPHAIDIDVRTPSPRRNFRAVIQLQRVCFHSFRRPVLHLVPQSLAPIEKGFDSIGIPFSKSIEKVSLALWPTAKIILSEIISSPVEVLTPTTLPDFRMRSSTLVPNLMTPPRLSISFRYLGILISSFLHILVWWYHDPLTS